MKLAVNVDHFATIREARRSNEPEPVLAALLAEQAGAEGIVCHLRGDRRHIKERDLNVLREVVKTKLNLEMAATEEMKKIAFSIKPDIVSLVPEREEELTTEGGLDVVSNEKHLTPFIWNLKNAGMKVIGVATTHPPEKLCDIDIVIRDFTEISYGKILEWMSHPQ